VQPRIPLAHRIRHLAVFSRLLLSYNVLASAIGATALIVLSRAGLLGRRPVEGPGSGTAAAGSSNPEAAAPVAGGGGAAGLLSDPSGGGWIEELGAGALIAGLLTATVGHWLAVLIVRLAHHDELALYRAGGWGPTGLWFASWALSGLIGVVLIALGAIP
jgi:hypothetical protein